MPIGSFFVKKNHIGSYPSPKPDRKTSYKKKKFVPTFLFLFEILKDFNAIWLKQFNMVLLMKDINLTVNVCVFRKQYFYRL